MAGREFPVEIDVGDELVMGHYVVTGQIIKVTATLGGSKQTQLGGSSPQSLARMLLRELAKETQD